MKSVQLRTKTHLTDEHFERDAGKSQEQKLNLILKVKAVSHASQRTDFNQETCLIICEPDCSSKLAFLINALEFFYKLPVCCFCPRVDTQG
jgi:hypothetical protein